MITPWGESQTIDKVATGIKFVTTASHGGYKITKLLLREIPRKVLNSTWGGLGRDGWFEEDCDAAIINCYFPEAMPWKDSADWDSMHAELKRLNPAAHADLTMKGIIK